MRKRSRSQLRWVEAKVIEVRPRNWLVAVIQVALRQWNSYGYKLMEQAAALGFETINSCRNAFGRSSGEWGRYCSYLTEAHRCD
jgi:hypothetical protein